MQSCVFLALQHVHWNLMLRMLSGSYIDTGVYAHGTPYCFQMFTWEEGGEIQPIGQNISHVPYVRRIATRDKCWDRSCVRQLVRARRNFLGNECVSVRILFVWVRIIITEVGIDFALHFTMFRFLTDWFEAVSKTGSGSGRHDCMWGME